MGKREGVRLAGSGLNHRRLTPKLTSSLLAFSGA